MEAGMDLLESRTRLTPAKLALVEISTGMRLTYQELSARVNRLAGCLKRLGVEKGDRIALLAPNSAVHLETLFAAGKLGAIFVPLNYRFAVAELAYVINDCAPKVVVFANKYAAAAAELAQHVSVPTWIDAEMYRSAVEDDDQSPETIITKIVPEDPWAIIYTGGTTGKPKGAVLSHRAIAGNSLNTIISWGITEKDVTPVYLPIFHTGGLNALTMPVLHAGGTVVIGQEFDPAGVLRVLEEERCTIALFVPTMYHMLVQAPEFENAAFGHMHTFLSGGAPCPLGIYEAFARKGVLFKEGYGLTEAGPNNFFMHPDHVAAKRGSVGVPMFYNSIRLVNDDGLDAADGETAEIWIQGPHVFSGYWNNPEESHKALADGWLRTGDLGRRDLDGFYYIVGRKKEMIITGGENVYPLEVEHLLNSHPDVDESVVIGLHDVKWGELVTAVIVPASGSTPDVEQLQAYCRDKIAGYKIPKRFIFVEKLPVTPVGKIDKKQLANEYGRKSEIKTEMV